MADGQTPNVAGMVADPDFQGLAPADKRAALGKLTGDASFGGLSDAETMQFISHFAAQKRASPLPAGTFQMRKGGPVIQPGMGEQAGPVPGTKTVVPIPGESFSDTMNRAIAAGRQTTPEQIQGATQVAKKEAPVALAAASLPGMIAAPGATIAAGIGGTIGGYGARKGAEALGASPETAGYAELGGSLVGGLAGGIGYGPLKGAIVPNAERAGVAMNRITSAAKDIKVPLYDANAAALRAKEIADAGTSLPKPVSNFLRRVLNPDKPPVSLEEARDFYTNISKLTGKEWSEFNGPMKRQVATFAKALGDNIEQALNASKPGEGTALRGAMDEYHNAMLLKSMGGKALKIGGGLLTAGGAEEALRYLWRTR